MVFINTDTIKTTNITSELLSIDSIGALQLNSSAGTINIGNDIVTQNINIGTGAAARTLTIGNTTTNTAVNIDASSSGITLSGGTLKFTTLASIRVGTGTPISTLTGGSTGWIVMDSYGGAHAVIGVRANDNSDSFSVVGNSTLDGSNNYNTLLYQVTNTGNSKTLGIIQTTNGRIEGTGSTVVKIASTNSGSLELGATTIATTTKGQHKFDKNIVGTITTVASGNPIDGYDMSGKNILRCGTTGIVEFRSFQNGVAGQIVNIYNDGANNVILKHSLGTYQKSYCPGSLDITLDAGGYKSTTVLCDGTSWFVTSKM